MSTTVEELVQRSRVAQKQFEFATQEQADQAAKAICRVVYSNAETLGKMAAEETRMGNLADKIAKCRNKSSLIWHSIKDRKSVGILSCNEETKMLEIAKPMGVVASVVPSTNPVVTPMSNGAFAMKTRNSVVFSPHPRAVHCTAYLVSLFREELKQLGLPEDLVLGLENATIEESSALMRLLDIIVATGGPGMVKAAYSSGKPALGVGAGNVQCIVDEDADLEEAAKKIIIGRSFDNGLICLGEQTVFVPASKYELFVEAMKENGTYYIEDAQTVLRMRDKIFPQNGPINRDIVGKSATEVAETIDLKVPRGTRVIAIKGQGTGHSEPLCREKMCPVITLLPYDTFERGVAMMNENLELEGKGHSVGVHSNNDAHIEYVGIQCPVSRIIVNQPCGTTGGGSPINRFVPTTTLGCGSWGNNSFSGNLDFVHLLNISRVGYPLDKPYLDDFAQVWD